MSSMRGDRVDREISSDIAETREAVDRSPPSCARARAQDPAWNPCPGDSESTETRSPPLLPQPFRLMLAAVEVVLGLREPNTPDCMGVVTGVAAVIVPALSDADALLAMLPVILVSASAYIVRPILELLVSQPYEGPIGTTFDDAPR